MNMTEIGGIVRAIAATALGWAAGKGYIAEGDVATLAAAVVAIGTAIWSVVAKKRAA